MAAQRQTKAKAVALSDFAGRMKQARNAAEFSLMDAAFAIRGILPEPMWVSVDPIRRMEVGQTDEVKADPMLVRALAAIYGVTVEDLSPVAAEHLAKLAQLMAGEQDMHGRRCTSRAWQQSLWIDPHFASAA